MNTYKRVTQFHQTFNHPVAMSPTMQSREWRLLRARMILEEAAEAVQALGFAGDLRIRMTDGPIIDLHGFLADEDIDLTKVAKELSDIDYVVQGTNVGMGLPAEAVATCTHDSNMSKVGPDGKPIYREDGKVLKGPTYFKAEPRIAGLLEICKAHPNQDLRHADPNVIEQYGEVAHHGV